jgi:hypothetical protein
MSLPPCHKRLSAQFTHDGHVTHSLEISCAGTLILYQPAGQGSNQKRSSGSSKAPRSCLSGRPGRRQSQGLGLQPPPFFMLHVRTQHPHLDQSSKRRLGWQAEYLRHLDMRLSEHSTQISILTNYIFSFLNVSFSFRQSNDSSSGRSHPQRFVSFRTCFLFLCCCGRG